MNILSDVQKGAALSLEDHKTIARRFIEETIAQGNLEIFDTSFASHLGYHMYDTPLHSRASLRKLLEQIHLAFSGHAPTIHDLVAEGDKVAVRFSYAAQAHQGQFGNNPPTGQPLQIEATMFFHFEQGKVTDVWASYEGASFDLTPA